MNARYRPDRPPRRATKDEAKATLDYLRRLAGVPPKGQLSLPLDPDEDDPTPTPPAPKSTDQASRGPGGPN